MDKISIRRAPTAIPGLLAMIDYISLHDKKDVRDMTMVEVGSYVGDSTRQFAQRFKKVISIDPFLNGYDKDDDSSEGPSMEIIYAQFKEDILDKFDNVEHHKLASVEGAQLFEDNIFDFVYIDGNHLEEFVELDMAAWLPKVRRPGWIGGHDFQHKRAPGVKPAVLKYVKAIDKHFPDTSWIKRLY